MSIDATRATQVVDRYFVDFDTAKQGDPSKADSEISTDDLQAVADNRDNRFSPQEVEAAKFLLESQSARSFLDVGAGKGHVDGIISREDVTGAQLKIDSGGLDKALLDTANGRGGADGYVGNDDIVAALRDPGIPQGLKDALAHLPPGLPLQTQIGAAISLHNNGTDPAAVSTLNTLFQSAAFKGLDEPQQQQALALFGGISTVSQKAREDLASRTPLHGGDHDPNDPPTFKVDLSDPKNLQQYLSTYAKPVDKWRDAQPASGVPDNRRQPYTISGPESTTHEFPSATKPDTKESQDAWKYTVTINGKNIDVYIPKTLDMGKYSYPTIDQIAKGLAAQPKASIDATNSVLVNPTTPKETKDRKVVDSGADMYAIDGSININPHGTDSPRTQRDFDYTFMHESAHLVKQPVNDPLLARLQGLPAGWNEAVAHDRLFSTHYAGDNYTVDPGDPSKAPSENPGEDFAEAYLIYYAVKGTPDEAQMRLLMPERFAILDKMFA